MFNVYFILRGRTGSKNQHLEAELNSAGDTHAWTILFSPLPGTWERTKRAFVEPTEACINANKMLLDTWTGMQAIYLKHVATFQNEPPPKEIFNAYYMIRATVKRTIFDLIKEYVRDMPLAPATQEIYKLNLPPIINDFLTRQYDDIHMDIKDVDLAWLYQLDIFLRKRESKNPVKPGQTLALTTRMQYIKHIKALFRHASTKGLISKYPFDNFTFAEKLKGPQVRKDTGMLSRVISPEFLIKIEITPPPVGDPMHKTWLQFLFQTWTGISWVDMDGETGQDFQRYIRRDFEGKECIAYNRQKTGEVAIIPLFPETQSILEKLNWDIRTDCTDSTAFARRIKKLLDWYEIPGNFGAHTGRHVFGERMLAKGFSMEAVSRMMGHATVKTTERNYAKIDDTKIFADYARIQQTEVKIQAIATINGRVASGQDHGGNGTSQARQVDPEEAPNRFDD